MLGWWTAASLAVKIGVVLIILAAFAGLAYLIQRAVFHWGYDAAVVELSPKIAKAEGQRDTALADLKNAKLINDEFAVELGRLQALTAEQQKSIDEYKIATLQAEIALRKALVNIAAKEKRYTAEIARLLAIANDPVITENDCAEADSILRGLMRDRLRDPAGATPP